MRLAMAAAEYFYFFFFWFYPKGVIRAAIK